MNITELNTVTTGNTAIDWMIARINTFDHSDKELVQFIGEFKGEVPHRMITQVRDYFKGTKNNSMVLIDTETESLIVSATIPSLKGNHRVVLSISYCAEPKGV